MRVVVERMRLGGLVMARNSVSPLFRGTVAKAFPALEQVPGAHMRRHRRRVCHLIPDP
jgi:hypothetical protein